MRMQIYLAFKMVNDLADVLMGPFNGTGIPGRLSYSALRYTAQDCGYTAALVVACR